MDMTPRRFGSRSARHAKWGAALLLLVTLALLAVDLSTSYRQLETEAGRQASGLSQLLAERLSSGIHEAGLILQSSNQIPEVQRLLRYGSLDTDARQNLAQKLQQQLQLAPTSAASKSWTPPARPCSAASAMAPPIRITTNSAAGCTGSIPRKATTPR